MSITLLRTFVAIVDTGSFQAAADRVFVSPAAVSQQMRTLEANFQASLFDRSRRTPQLTVQGRALVPQAREVLRIYDEMLASLTEDGALRGDLIIGAVSSVMSSLAPRAIHDLMTGHPDLHVRVMPGPSHDLLAAVERGEADAAIMSEPPRIRPHLDWRPFARERMMLIAARDAAPADAAELLTTRPYIRMSRQAWVSDIVEDVLQETGVKVRDSMELDNLETISKMVAHDLGIAIVPQPCMPDEMTVRLRFLPVGGVPRYRVMGVLARADSPKAPLIDGLCAALEAVLAAAAG